MAKHFLAVVGIVFIMIGIGIPSYLRNQVIKSKTLDSKTDEFYTIYERDQELIRLFSDGLRNYDNPSLGSFDSLADELIRQERGLPNRPENVQPYESTYSWIASSTALHPPPVEVLNATRHAVANDLEQLADMSSERCVYSLNQIHVDRLISVDDDIVVKLSIKYRANDECTVKAKIEVNEEKIKIVGEAEQIGYFPETNDELQTTCETIETDNNCLIWVLSPIPRTYGQRSVKIMSEGHNPIIKGFVIPWLFGLPPDIGNSVGIYLVPLGIFLISPSAVSFFKMIKTRRTSNSDSGKSSD